MTSELFEKIINDCTSFPLPEIEPFLQGDPFADPDILARLELIRRRLPKTTLRLYTNGYGLTPTIVDQLCLIGVDELTISLNTLDPLRYRSMMGVPLERTLDNLEYAMAKERQKQIARAVTLRMTVFDDTTAREQDEFEAFARRHGVRPYVVGLFNYKGDIASGLPVPRYGCEHVTRLDILASGNVTLCCMDQDGEYGWGSVRDMSVLELYRHEVARRYRSAHQTGQRRSIDPCGSCNLFWPLYDGTNVVERARTGVEYCLYRLRHRPMGRQNRRAGSGPASLEQLRTQQVELRATRRARPPIETDSPPQP